jgi:hypothetical protein
MIPQISKATPIIEPIHAKSFPSNDNYCALVVQLVDVCSLGYFAISDAVMLSASLVTIIPVIRSTKIVNIAIVKTYFHEYLS